MGLAPVRLLAAAVVLAIGDVAVPPVARLVDSVVGHVVNQTAATLAARRGLRLTHPVLVRLVDRAHMQAATAGDEVLTAAAAKPSPSDERGAPPDPSLRRRLFARLGLTEPHSALEPDVPSPAPGPEVTGRYDAIRGRVLVASWTNLADGRFALTRDIAQALLDRRFDVPRWLGAAGPQTLDASLARQALALGDATVQAFEDLDPESGLPSPRALAGLTDQVRTQLAAEAASAPAIELQARLFVELDGLSFVAHFRARAPWKTVDEIWRRPPESTEQILHPEKYEHAENPDDVGRRLIDLPDPGGPARARFQVVYRDTLGELGARLFLGRAVDSYRAERAATGWGGDSALLFQDAGEADQNQMAPDVFVAWITTWDDDTDADDFAAQASLALGRLAHATPRDVRLPLAGRPLRMTDGDGRLFALDHRRRVVGLLIGAPAAAGDLLAPLMSAGVAPASLAGPRRTGRGPRGQRRSLPR